MSYLPNDGGPYIPVDQLPVTHELTPEEEVALRQIAIKFIQRQLDHPELTKLSHQTLVKMMSDEKLLSRISFLECAVEAETYFELKDELAVKGIEIFNPKIEDFYCSYEVAIKRANLMASYICNHPEMLPNISKDRVIAGSVGNHFFDFARAWCYVYKQELAGVEFYTLKHDDQRAIYVYAIFNRLDL